MAMITRPLPRCCSVGDKLGAVAFGIPTPAGGVPTTGSATFSGSIFGQTTETYFNGLYMQTVPGNILGDIDLSFNFGGGTLSGSISPSLYIGYSPKTAVIAVHQHGLLDREHDLFGQVRQHAERCEQLFGPLHRSGRPGADRQLHLSLRIAGGPPRLPGGRRLRRQEPLGTWRNARRSVLIVAAGVQVPAAPALISK